MKLTQLIVECYRKEINITFAIRVGCSHYLESMEKSLLIENSPPLPSPNSNSKVTSFQCSSIMVLFFSWISN